MRQELGQIMSEATAFMKSRIILTAVELDLFTRIHESPAGLPELARQMAFDKRAMTRLLDCLVTLGFLEKQDGLYRVSEEGKFLSSHHPETLLPAVRHMAFVWDGWNKLTHVIKNGPDLQRKPIEDQLSERQVDSFLGAMHTIARDLSREVAEFYDAGAYKRLLDIGGGAGTYTIAFLEKNLHMQGVIFDMENVIPTTRETIQKAGLGDRVELVAGDFYSDELPSGCDMALLSAIIHQNSPGQNVELYAKIYRALNRGGVILIRDHIMDESRTKPVDGTLFAVNMLVLTPGGDTYTFEEVKETLETAGFTGVKWIRVGERMDSLIEAIKSDNGLSGPY
ncbi:O-methyltransferase, family 2 [uncultured Desulfobacterium sp.]|uniref:O-methyltransferase, family 2 n=1 Tax=uncultured Desulfobacterium sp. TaxID=201089 RepID=A0A445MVA1_9BACT|nr:O-methyltransferase, family 2 [uncultured Desulfobacterium sp.]